MSIGKKKCSHSSDIWKQTDDKLFLDRIKCLKTFLLLKGGKSSQLETNFITENW